MFAGSLAALVSGVFLIVLGVMQNTRAVQEYTDYAEELPQPGTIWIVLGVVVLALGAALFVFALSRARRASDEDRKGLFSLSGIAGAVLDVFPQIFGTVCAGFTLTLIGATLLARSFPTAHVYVLGLSFYLATLLFYLIVALARLFKRIRSLNAVWYRVLHFLISALALYLCYFSLWPSWRFSMREVQGVLDEGVIAADRVIFGLLAFGICYFAVIGLMALGKKLRSKRMRDAESYVSIVDRK